MNTRSRVAQGRFSELVSNILKDQDVCVPVCLNIVFGYELFNSKQSFVDSLGTRYKASLNKKNKLGIDKLGFASSSALHVVDEKKIVWVKKVLCSSTEYNRKRLPSSTYNKAVLSEVVTFFETPRKFLQKEW